ncbi:MAG: M48 family metallopeptidase [Candidatus Omnitrophica bacterium]|nr:M48 family metallopeptidase [Candidatus Omnitrophota bacterium]
MLRKSKILSFLLCFCLLFEQAGFAQVAGTLDISGHIAAFRDSLIQDKFRPLHLRSLGYDKSQNNFRLLLDKGDLKNPKKPELEATTKTLLNYFFVGLTLPNDAFWVNLRPDSENNIIDSDLATTDVGKILLEADLQLKKDTAKFTSPETPEGKKYWDKLYQKAGELLGYENITIPTLTRPWIVPGEIIIRETAGAASGPEQAKRVEGPSAYIYKATLKVMLEQDYLKNSATYNFDDPRLKTLNEYSSQLIRDLIIPKLTQEVNTSQRYAPLRQVYYSLILAQWFKARFYGKAGLYSSLIDKKSLQGLTSKISWSKTTYFKAYQKSFKDGEYNTRQPISTPYGQTIRNYFSGGFVCNVPMPAVPGLGVVAERTEGPTKVTAILGDAEHSPLPRTESIVGALAVGGNTMDPSETKVTITEEAPSPSGLPAGGLQSGASSVAPTASQPNLGAQVVRVKHLDRLLKLLNVLRRSENVPEILESTPDRDIMEFCLNYLEVKGFIATTTDEDGNVIITINNSALNHPDETARRFIEAIQGWVINPEGGVKAVNFQGKDGVWMIVGFESELRNKDTLEHEQQEIKFRKQGLSWAEAHNQAVVETNKGQKINQEEANKRRAGRQDEIGAMQGSSFGPKESRKRLIADRLGISFDQMSSWERANPEKAKRLEEMAERDDRIEVYLKSIDSREVIVDRNNPEFANLYSEAEGIVRRLLEAAGFNPDNFSFYLLDSTAENARVLRYSNKIFVNIGLIKFIVKNGGSKDALAFVLAHEIRHILQWVEDTIEGKPLERGIAGLVGAHADEYDSDYALALIDKAGYSVRDAGFFFAKIIEKKGKSSGISLGFLTHPPTVERLRKIERNVLKFFWMNFFNKSEHFSDASNQELNNRTTRRKFQEEVAQGNTKEEFTRCFDKAQSPEEFIFVLMIAIQKGISIDINNAYNNFLAKFKITNNGAKEMYRIIFDIVDFDLKIIILDKKESPLIQVRREMGYPLPELKEYDKKELPKRLAKKSITELIELLSVEVLKPLDLDGIHVNAFYNFPYYFFTRALCIASGERIEDLYRSGLITDVQQFLELMNLFERRYAETSTYTGLFSRDAWAVEHLRNIFDKMVLILIRILNEQVQAGREVPEYQVQNMLHFIDFLEDYDGINSSDEQVIKSLCEFTKHTSLANKNMILGWLIRGDAEGWRVDFRDRFFGHMAEDVNLVDILPGMGNGAEFDLDVLFSIPYFVKKSMFF